MTRSSSPLSSSSSALPSPFFPPVLLPQHRSSPISVNAAFPSPALSEGKFVFDAYSPYPDSPQSRSRSSSLCEVVLTPGDLLGEGLELQGEPLQLLPMDIFAARNFEQHSASDPEPAREFEVVRRLGRGSYAVVYLVREVLERGRSLSDDGCIGGRMDGADPYTSVDGSLRTSTVYGREYALKVLSKANLDEQAISAQLIEANIHQSLPTHPNIVTLHRTLSTSAFLLLLLEFVPGEDLFYFLEQARDHYAPDPASYIDAAPGSPTMGSKEDSSNIPSSRTPPTPSLLSTLNPAQLLSKTRLKLIASMFAQMCEAVAVCHEVDVFHRDIKPENFIVTDGWVDASDSHMSRERKVVVKLSDFGLSTNETESADMDCGSAPYMSYECRNNCAPKYSPRAADVWSLGVVLINMLYHINPWTDTTHGACSSFSAFRSAPTQFFMSRFAGMTETVAIFLSSRVFCVLPTDDHMDTQGSRVSAEEFGKWVKDLPKWLGAEGIEDEVPELGLTDKEGVKLPTRHKRGASTSSIGFSLSSLPPTRRPSSRAPSISSQFETRRGLALSIPASSTVSTSSPLATSAALPSGVAALVTPVSTIRSRALASLSRAPSIGELPTVFDNDLEEEEEEFERGRTKDGEFQLEQDRDQDQEPNSRSTSVARRRKRGARKGKNQIHKEEPTDVASPLATHVTDTLETLAAASQTLAREISMASKSSRAASRRRPVDTMASPMSPVPAMFVPAVPAVPPMNIPTANTVAAVAKKPSKWKLSFGKSDRSVPANMAVVEEKEKIVGMGLGISLGAESAQRKPNGVSTTASNVACVINGLSAPPLLLPHVSPIAVPRRRSNSRTRPYVPSSLSRPIYPPSVSFYSPLDPASSASYSTKSLSQYSSTSSINLTNGSGTGDPWARGRRRGRLADITDDNVDSANTAWSSLPAQSSSPSVDRWAQTSANGQNPPERRYAPSDRNPSPMSTRSPRGNAVTSGASSFVASSVYSGHSSASSNWRSSIMSSSTSMSSTSAFTSFSNSSVRSVSTVATSVSASSWRHQSSASLASAAGKPAPSTTSSRKSKYVQQVPQVIVKPPPGIKIMTGVPYAIDEFPRQMLPDGDMLGGPQIRKPRVRKPKDLPTINERLGQGPAAPRSPLSQRFDASASSTNLRAGVNVSKGKQREQYNGNGNSGNGIYANSTNASSGAANGSNSGSSGGITGEPVEGDNGTRKVPKGQINALAKMRSAFKL